MPAFTPKELDKLTGEELINELHPERITWGLRWTADIAYQKAVAAKIESNLEEKQASAELMQKLGAAFCETGQYDKAIKYYKDALSKANTVEPSAKRDEMIAKCHFGIGVATREPLRKQDSLQALQQAIDDCEKFKDANFTAYCAIKANALRNKGLSYLAAGEHMLAYTAFTKSRETATESASLAHFMIPVITYQGLAQVLHAEKNANHADHLREGLEYLTDAAKQYAAHPEAGLMAQGCEDYGSFQCHLAKANLLSKHYDDALKAYQIAHEIRKGLQGQHQNRYADVLVGRGRAYMGKEMWVEAARDFAQAKQIFESLPNPEISKANEAADYAKSVQLVLAKDKAKSGNDDAKQLVGAQFRKFVAVSPKSSTNSLPLPPTEAVSHKQLPK